MVRHNTTFELVSSYQVSWVICRHRASQTASISPFFIPNKKDTFSTTVGLVIEAYEDACARFDANGQQPWMDLYQKNSGGHTTHTGKDENDDDGDGDNLPPKKKVKTSSSTSAAPSTSSGGPHSFDLVCPIFSRSAS
jgi:hypothetical protein